MPHGFTHTELALLSTDRRVDPRLLDAAKALDAAEAKAAPAPCTATIARITVKPEVIRARMITAAYDAIVLRGRVERADFARAGFVETDIDSHARFAIAAAALMLPAQTPEAA